MKDKSRYRDMAALLPWLGLFLFTPPVLFLFKPGLAIGGVPLLPVYLFATWLLLIIASRQLTRHLVEDPAAPQTDAQPVPTKPRPVSRHDGA